MPMAGHRLPLSHRYLLTLVLEGSPCLLLVVDVEKCRMFIFSVHDQDTRPVHSDIDMPRKYGPSLTTAHISSHKSA
jgi:hypothetical protein